MTARSTQGSQSFQIWDMATGQCITEESLKQLQPRASRAIGAASSVTLGNGSVTVIGENVQIVRSRDLTTAVQSVAEPILKKEPEKQESANAGRAGMKRSRLAAGLSPFAQKCQKVFRHTYRVGRTVGVKRSRAAAGLPLPSQEGSKLPRSADAPIALLPVELRAGILFYLLKEDAAASILSARAVCRDWSSCSQESFRMAWNALNRTAPENPVDLKKHMQDIELEMEEKGLSDDYFTHFKMLTAAIKEFDSEVRPLFLETCQQECIHSWEKWPDESVIMMWEAAQRYYGWDSDPSQPAGDTVSSSNDTVSTKEDVERILRWLADPANRLTLDQPPRVDPDTTSMDLNERGLRIVPLDIGKLIGVDFLNLNQNGLSALPTSIGDLKKLTCLNVKVNRLTSLPDSIWNLTGLVQLHLNNNRLTSLSEAMGKLTQLRQFSWSYNRLTSVPASILGLTSLKKLDLDHNELGSFPEPILGLGILRRLKIGHNGLTSLPDSIGEHLRQLKNLEVDGNQLPALPQSILSLHQLQHLNAANNQLTSLPDSLGRLTLLRSLNVSGNRLTSLPASIGGLGALFRPIMEFMSCTGLNRIPSEALGRIGIAGTVIASLRQVIRHGREIDYPLFAMGLRSLTILDVEDNQLTSLPECIEYLTALQRLSLANNPLTSIPNGIEKLTSLRTLPSW